MARILFTWELGRGLGHLVRYKALIASLIQDGHDIHYIARNAEKVRYVNPQPEIQVEELSPEFTRRSQQVTDPKLGSYSTLLFNCGFSDINKLASRLARWVSRIKEIRPDCIIADHSPTVLLANRILGIPLIVAGNGFTLPPASQPMTLFQPEHGENQELNINFENRLCDILTESIRKLDPGAAEIVSPASLLEVEQSWLMTFEELDCYGTRDSTNYVGSHPNDGFGEHFEWPEASGPKVFAYLQSEKGLEALGRWVSKREVSLCLVMPGLSKTSTGILHRSFSPSRCYISEKPVNFARMSGEAAMGVSNGNANIMANLALAGLPQLAIPQSMENYMEARQVVRVTCGLMAPGPDFRTLSAQLDELVDNTIYRQSAENLSQKYVGNTSVTQMKRLRNKMCDLID